MENVSESQSGKRCVLSALLAFGILFLWVFYYFVYIENGLLQWCSWTPRTEVSQDFGNSINLKTNFSSEIHKELAKPALPTFKRLNFSDVCKKRKFSKFSETSLLISTAESERKFIWDWQYRPFDGGVWFKKDTCIKTPGYNGSSMSVNFCLDKQLTCANLMPHPQFDSSKHTILWRKNHTICGNSRYVCRKLAVENGFGPPIQSSPYSPHLPSPVRITVPLSCETEKLFTQKSALEMLDGETIFLVGKSLTRRFAFALSALLFSTKKDDDKYHEPFLQLIGSNKRCQVYSAWHGGAWDDEALEKELNSLNSVGSDWHKQLENYKSEWSKEKRFRKPSMILMSMGIQYVARNPHLYAGDEKSRLWIGMLLDSLDKICPVCKKYWRLHPPTEQFKKCRIPRDIKFVKSDSDFKVIRPCSGKVLNKGLINFNRAVTETINENKRFKHWTVVDNWSGGVNGNMVDHAHYSHKTRHIFLQQWLNIVAREKHCEMIGGS